MGLRRLGPVLTHSRAGSTALLAGCCQLIKYVSRRSPCLGEVWVVAEESLIEYMRRKSWDMVGVDYNPKAALAAWAAALGLGKPESQEFEAEYGGKVYRLQCFSHGIVYCPVGDWLNVRSLYW